MNQIIDWLYKENFFFSLVNDHSMDDLEYIVFSNFAMYINELIYIDIHGLQMSGKFPFIELEFLIDYDLKKLINEAFSSISHLLNKEDDKINDIIYASVYWNFFVNKDIDSYIKKYLTNVQYDTFKIVIADLNK